VTTHRFITSEKSADGRIATISLDRPRQRNAQNRGLLIELDEALLAAEADDEVRVIILRGNGLAFSSGHDLGSSDSMTERTPGPAQHPSYQNRGGSRLSGERQYIQEWHYFFQNVKRWRELRKITIASVKGPVFAGGLMLAWACDLIVASDDTVFADVVGTRLGMCGVEYFAHPWEFGPRKTKELMLTGDAIDAVEAHRLGMVTKIFAPEDLDEKTVEFAQRIAELPSMTSLLVKESVNQTVDQMGFSNALAATFSLHQMQHSYWAQVTSDNRQIGTPEFGVVDWREAPPVMIADPYSVRGTREAT
jgi:enoyl-CoA hydratase